MPAPDPKMLTTRGSGYDHRWFEYRASYRRRITWPGGAPVALWITVPIEFFPLDGATQPVRPVGAMERPYPDYYAFSHRDYGNRIGIYRIMRVLDDLGLRATAAINSDVALRYPRIVQEATARNWEIMANGVNMGRIIHAGLDRDAEHALIDEAVTTLARVAERPIAGWHSPAHAQSMHTFELLAAQGITHVADWTNDDLPYRLTTPAGSLTALPLNHEWSDRTILMQYGATVESYQAQVLAAFRRIESEAKENGGRIFSLTVTPWIVGAPYYIRFFKDVLETIVASGSVRCVTGAEIAEWAQQDE